MYELYSENFTGKTQSVRIYWGEWKGVLDAFSFEDEIGDLKVCRWVQFALAWFFLSIGGVFFFSCFRFFQEGGS